MTDGGREPVGFFGLLGSGNLGNDASFEVVWDWLRRRHPGAPMDAMCMGPEELAARFGIETTALLWSQRTADRRGRPPAAVRAFGKALDHGRLLAWVRRHGAVIVPGMGVLEASLPLKPWQTPYELFLLCLFGRLTGTRVALVSVGANPVSTRATRWLLDSAARLAYYRSFRDGMSVQAMLDRGVDASRDAVYPDLVFGLGRPPTGPGDPEHVGLGIMAFRGGNDDRARAHEVYEAYMTGMKGLARWLVDSGHVIHLFWGDDCDEAAAVEVMSDLDRHRPGCLGARVTAEPCTSLQEVMARMTGMGTVVATRYHGVLSALRMGKPTIAVGYSGKHQALMADVGLAEFCHDARAIDLDRLIEQFQRLERDAAKIRRSLEAGNQSRSAAVEQQLEVLSQLCFPELDATAVGTSQGRRYWRRR